MYMYICSYIRNALEHGCSHVDMKYRSPVTAVRNTCVHFGGKVNWRILRIFILIHCFIRWPLVINPTNDASFTDIYISILVQIIWFIRLSIMPMNSVQIVLYSNRIIQLLYIVLLRVQDSPSHFLWILGTYFFHYTKVKNYFSWLIDQKWI